jgi:hypothetical protein
MKGINAFKKAFGGVEKQVINYNSIMYDLLLWGDKIRQKL